MAATASALLTPLCSSRASAARTKSKKALSAEPAAGRVAAGPAWDCSACDAGGACAAAVCRQAPASATCVPPAAVAACVCCVQCTTGVSCVSGRWAVGERVRAACVTPVGGCSRPCCGPKRSWPSAAARLILSALSPPEAHSTLQGEGEHGAWRRGHFGCQQQGLRSCMGGRKEEPRRQGQDRTSPAPPAALRQYADDGLAATAAAAAACAAVGWLGRKHLDFHLCGTQDVRRLGLAAPHGKRRPARAAKVSS